MNKRKTQELLEMLAEREFRGVNNFVVVIDYVRKYKECFGEDEFINEYVCEYLDGRQER